MPLALLGTFYVAMVGAAYLVDLVFGVTGLIPTQRSATVMTESVSWNYATWLNIAFLILAALLLLGVLPHGRPGDAGYDGRLAERPPRPRGVRPAHSCTSGRAPRARQPMTTTNPDHDSGLRQAATVAVPEPGVHPHPAHGAMRSYRGGVSCPARFTVLRWALLAAATVRPV
ncbi:hypothetical protein GCM10017788_40230 [Amycolatopsis acidiphila]|nr:hypothetical protein GCM10017788_40230 [Amycolatopsis acidiphila]